jgi:pSer/pThr/pTyr-binding forkhead associated (FHA) protein
MESPPKIQLLLKDRLIQEMPIEGDELRIGRMKENDLVVNNLAVSRFHAVLKTGTGGVLWIEDLGSENGTLINGTRVEGSARVCEGDDITIGKHTLRIGGMATNDPVIAAAPVGASDAWDAAQTYFADVPADPPNDVAVTGEPVSLDEELEAEPMVEASGDDSGDEAQAVVEMEPAAPASALGPADSPDPSGVYSFSEEEILEDGVPDEAPDFEVSSGDLVAEAAPLTDAPPTPAGEHTALFDFGQADLANAEASEPLAEPEPEPAAVPDAAGVDTLTREVRRNEEVLVSEWVESGAEVAAAPPDLSAHAGWIVQREGKLEGVVAWESDEMRAGRADDCQIVLASSGVSRCHVTLARSEDGYEARDEGSVNGTWINGLKLEGTRLLRPGDVVKIEEYELTFVLDHQPVSNEVCAPVASTAAASSAPSQTLFDAPMPESAEVDLLDEAEEDEEKILEVSDDSTLGSTGVNLSIPTQEVVQLELEIPRASLPPGLRLAMEEAGEDALRLPAEIRIRLR